MPYLIRLPEPCQEDWNLMTPNERGRHCDQCSKTVVDFTGWQPAEIIFYLQTHSGACGRFGRNQLEVPLPAPEDFVKEVIQLPVSFIKRVAAIFLFVFGLMAGSSCTMTGKNAPPPDQQAIGDTTIVAPVLTGEPAFVPADTDIQPIAPKSIKEKVPQEEGNKETSGLPLGGAPVLEEIKIDTLPKDSR